MIASLCSVLRSKSFNINQQVRHKIFYRNGEWRTKKGLSLNPTAFGPLTNLPDYSFKDGRVVPFGSHQKKRIDKQKEILYTIKTLVGEIDAAVERHRIKQEKKILRVKNILDSKLKEKGRKLLAPSTKIHAITEK